MNFALDFYNIKIPVSADQNTTRIHEFTMSRLSSSTVSSNILASKNNMECEIPLKFCRDLLEFLYHSNRKLVKQLLGHIYIGNRNRTLRNQFVIYDPASQVANYRIKCVIGFLLHYFTAARKSPENEVVRKFAAVEQISITNLLNDIGIRILSSNNRGVDWKDTVVDFIFKCFKHLAAIHIAPESEMLTSTQRYMQPNFSEFKAIAPVTEGECTKSSKSYIDKEFHTCEVSGEKEAIFVNSKYRKIEISIESDNSSASDSDVEASFKIPMYNCFYNDDNIRKWESSDDDDSDDDVFDCSLGRRHSMNSDDAFEIYFNDDEFKGAFSDCISDEIPATSGYPNQVSTQKVESSFRYQGFENPCFIEEPIVGESGYIKMVNDNWEMSMEGVPEEPRESTKVSFVSSPSLVTVHQFEREDDGYSYSTYVIDQMRFRCRIQNFETIMAPYMTLDHREYILRRNNSSSC